MRVLLLLAAVMLLFAAGAFAPDLATGCPNCKEAYIETDTGTSISSGYSASILLMMSMPFLVLGAVGLTIWRSMKKKRVSEEQVSSRQAR